MRVKYSEFALNFAQLDVLLFLHAVFGHAPPTVYSIVHFDVEHLSDPDHHAKLNGYFRAIFAYYMRNIFNFFASVTTFLPISLVLFLKYNLEMVCDGLTSLKQFTVEKDFYFHELRRHKHALKKRPVETCLQCSYSLIQRAIARLFLVESLSQLPLCTCQEPENGIQICICDELHWLGYDHPCPCEWICCQCTKKLANQMDPVKTVDFPELFGDIVEPSLDYLRPLFVPVVCNNCCAYASQPSSSIDDSGRNSDCNGATGVAAIMSGGVGAMSFGAGRE